MQKAENRPKYWFSDHLFILIMNLHKMIFPTIYNIGIFEKTSFSNILGGWGGSGRFGYSVITEIAQPKNGFQLTDLGC